MQGDPALAEGAGRLRARRVARQQRVHDDGAELRTRNLEKQHAEFGNNLRASRGRRMRTQTALSSFAHYISESVSPTETFNPTDDYIFDIIEDHTPNGIAMIGLNTEFARDFDTPTTYEEANRSAQSQEWSESMKREWESILKNNTGTLVQPRHQSARQDH